MRHLLAGQDFLFNLAAQTSHLDSMSRAGRRSRDQLHGATAAARSMPGGQSRDRDRACRNAADLWPAAISAGRRAPPAAPGRRQRRQQDGRRGLPPVVPRRLRDQDPLAAADQCLRARNADQGCAPDLPRHLAAPGHRRRAVRGLGRRAAARPALCRRRGRGISRAPRSRRRPRVGAQCRRRRPRQPVGSGRSDDRGQWRRELRHPGVSAGAQAHRYRRFPDRRPPFPGADRLAPRASVSPTGLRRSLEYYRSHLASYI